MSTVQIDQISTGAAQWHRQAASLGTALADCTLRPPLGLGMPVLQPDLRRDQHQGPPDRDPAA
jgi:hypothetical protein